MSFSVTYKIKCGEVRVVPFGAVLCEDNTAQVVIGCSNTYKNVIEGVFLSQHVDFRIPCPDDPTADRVADFIKKKFDLGEEVVFSGTFPNGSGSSIVITPCEHFLPKAVEK